jgi:putative ABC transport system permease protein
MFRHNLVIILRNFKRDKASFLINLIGLSTGLACALFIYLWVNDELHMDKFHKNDKQLFQVMKKGVGSNGEILTFEWTPGPLANALVEEMPEVEKAVTVMPNTFILNEGATKGILSANEIHIKATEQYVSQDFFNVFSYNLIRGDKKQVLSDKNSVVISDGLAQKLFHSTQNIVGKTVEWNKGEFSGIYLVSGVFEKPPANSTVQFDLLFTFELYRGINTFVNEWTHGGPSTYIVLKKDADIDLFNEKIGIYLQKKTNEEYQSLFIRRYSDKYLYDKYENGVQAGGRIEVVRLFSMIAFFILVIACINFMNLSTAKASGRLKEVGVKKTVGASRKALVAQYLGESLMMTIFSLILAVALVNTLLPQFNAITGKQLTLNLDTHALLVILGIALFTGFVSGSYPAFYLSRFNPASVLKGKLNASVSELWIRKGLVLFQFIISVILIVSVVVIYKQIGFILTKNLGYDKDNIICIKKEGKLDNNIESFFNEVKKIPGVVNASNYFPNLNVNMTGTTGINWNGKKPKDQVSFKYLFAGYDFVETLGIELVDGRTFSRDFSTEDSKILFNETAIKSMGLENPVGQTINLWGQNKQIVGVLRDFHFESLYENLRPCFLLFLSNEGNMIKDNVIIKIKAGTERGTIARLQKFYKEFNYGLPLEFKFLDDDYQAFYESEQRVSVLSRYFAGIAIIISCLGLFGLAAYSAERRTKEIGVRKVLGSSVPRIILLLSGDFTKIVLVSMLISVPLSYFITKHWLDSFAYRIDLQAWYFIGAGLTTLFIAWIIVGTQAVRAATTNPVKALRYE